MMNLVYNNEMTPYRFPALDFMKECFFSDVGAAVRRRPAKHQSLDTGFWLVAHQHSLTDSKPATGGEIFSFSIHNSWTVFSILEAHKCIFSDSKKQNKKQLFIGITGWRTWKDWDEIIGRWPSARLRDFSGRGLNCCFRQGSHSQCVKWTEQICWRVHNHTLKYWFDWEFL